MGLVNPSIINIFIYAIVFIFYKNRIIGTRQRKTNSCLLFFICLFSVFAFCDGDYYHYEEIYNTIIRSKSIETHMEQVYNFFAYNSIKSYSIFRFYIWGLAILFTTLATKEIGVNTNSTLFILMLVFITTFSYARVSLAMSVAVFGFSLLISNRKIKQIGGILIVASSILFHKTIIFMVACGIISLLLHDMSRKKLVITLFICFILGSALNILLLQFSNLEIYGGLEGTVLSGQKYLASEQEESGLGGMINGILNKAPYYLTILVYLKLVLKDNFLVLNNKIRFISTFSFITIIVASLFAFDFGVNTSIIYYRFLFMAMIPTIIFIGYCWYHKIEYRIIKFIVNIGSMGVVYKLLYYYYLQRLGLGV